MLGHAEDEEFAAIETAFTEDMQKFGTNFPQENQNYRKLPEYLTSTVQQLHDKLAESDDRIRQLDAANKQLTTEKENQIAIERKAQEDASKDLLEAKSDLASQLEKQNSELEQVKRGYEQSRKKLVDENSKLTKDVGELNGQLANMRANNDKVSRELSQLTNETFEKPDGRITWIDQGGGMVYLDLGSADGLRRQTSFSVYDVDANNLARAEKKASIEVTRLIGMHLAEAHVIDDETTNPIVPGDIVYSPAWEVGSSVRFALTGFMDIDNDGKSDRELVKRLIGMSGGLVDAEVADDGKREGKVSVETRYLVVGSQPTEKTSTNYIQADTQLRTEAKSFGVTEITVDRLLSDLGYQRISKSIALGRNADGNDYLPNRYDAGSNYRP